MGNRRRDISVEGEEEPQFHDSETEATVLPTQKTTKSKKKKKKKRPSDVTHEDVTECDNDEPTMAEKLESLDLLDDDKSKNNTRQEPSPIAIPPSADSVHVLLKQALHADDHALLLDCLYTRDEKVIAKSVLLLNPSDVLKLLKFLISMLQSRGAVLVCVLPWLRSLLSQHASSIVSHESSLFVLNSLFQLIESRISTFGPALKLSTSLDCLFAWIPDDESDEEGMTPAIVYEDKDSDDEESEDAMETDDDDDKIAAEIGAVVDSPRDSDGSEVMSD